MTADNKKALHAVIHGRVQGVGFRYSTINTAQRLGLKGYASNLFDGTVEVFAEGEPEKLNMLLSWLQTGPPLSHVTKVDHRYVNYSGKYKSFGIKY